MSLVLSFGLSFFETLIALRLTMGLAIFLFDEVFTVGGLDAIWVRLVGPVNLYIVGFCFSR